MDPIWRERVSSPYYIYGYLKNVFWLQFSTLSTAAIGNVHRGSLCERIDCAFHLRSRWQLSILHNSPEKGNTYYMEIFQRHYIYLYTQTINEGSTVCSLVRSARLLSINLVPIMLQILPIILFYYSQVIAYYSNDIY